MLRLIEIPQLDIRAKTFSKMLTHIEQVEDLARRVNTVRGALQAMQGSEQLIQLLQVCLALGNFMNAKSR